MVTPHTQNFFKLIISNLSQKIYHMSNLKLTKDVNTFDRIFKIGNV